ncbi:sensor histidine kinase [Streptosporangium lutulentum]
MLTGRAAPSATGVFVRAGVAGALGLVAVVASLLISYRVGSGLTRELAGLRRSAIDLAEVRLPRVMEKLRRGEKVDVNAEAPPLEPLGSTAEVLDVAAAFDSVQHRAVDAAVEQARLREGVGQAFRNLARRSQSLLQRQLKMLDGMQKQAEDPEALENLFRLDHLTTRMRRHAEGLVILSGGASGRRWRSSVPMEDVLRGAAAQVENYARVRIYSMEGVTVVGNAAADMMHLFAEIIENATVFSPPGSQVSVQGGVVGRGFAIEIEDRGLGLSPERLAAINERLASPPEFDPAETDRLGFAVVGLLASRYGVEVKLRVSPYGGTGVVVVLPTELLGEPEQPERRSRCWRCCRSARDPWRRENPWRRSPQTCGGRCGAETAGCPAGCARRTCRRGWARSPDRRRPRSRPRNDHLRRPGRCSARSSRDGGAGARRTTTKARSDEPEP